MGNAAESVQLTAAEYIAWEAEQPTRHEFVAGEIFAMTGVEDRHNVVAQNLLIALRAHLDGTPCKVYISDIKLRVEAADSFYYPDVMVTCSATDHAAKHIKTEPQLVVEILSLSTAACDRGDKFAAYRLLPTLQEYLLIDTRSLRCDLYRKGADGLWVLHPVEVGQDLRLASVDLVVSAARLFAQ